MREKLLFQKFLEFLREDMPNGDITTELAVDEDREVEAIVVAKEDGIVSGTELLTSFLRELGIAAEALRKSGETVGRGGEIMRLRGNARSILQVERTLLNLLSHMSGIATATRRLVEKAAKSGKKVKVAATRKTLPGLREFEKMAVIHGGGDPHRFSLSDMVMIKDNHKRIAGGLKEAIRRAKRKSFSMKLEVEVETPEEALIAAQEGADIVMLDNFTPEEVRRTVELLEKAGLRAKVILEASGGITIENIMEYAKTGVDVISSGFITKSARALDISLEVVG